MAVSEPLTEYAAALADARRKHKRNRKVYYVAVTEARRIAAMTEHDYKRWGIGAPLTVVGREDWI